MYGTLLELQADVLVLFDTLKKTDLKLHELTISEEATCCSTGSSGLKEVEARIFTPGLPWGSSSFTALEIIFHFHFLHIIFDA